MMEMLNHGKSRECTLKGENTRQNGVWEMESAACKHQEGWPNDLLALAKTLRACLALDDLFGKFCSTVGAKAGFG